MHYKEISPSRKIPGKIWKISFFIVPQPGLPEGVLLPSSRTVWCHTRQAVPQATHPWFPQDAQAVPRTPKWSQSDPKVTPKWSQSDPKVMPKWSHSDPKETPKWSQSDTKVTPKWFKWRQSDPKVTPTWSQSDAKMIPKSCQHDPKVISKWYFLLISYLIFNNFHDQHLLISL